MFFFNCTPRTRVQLICQHKNNLYIVSLFCNHAFQTAMKPYERCHIMRLEDGMKTFETLNIFFTPFDRSHFTVNFSFLQDEE